ncbi:MAG: hypothetical protein M3R38_13685 [Actinomycetota bacterium]|nr:hypothetical protein [Actinomycetota bacterium]
MTRNVVITALVAVLMAGFVLAYLALRPGQSQPAMGNAEPASQQTGGVQETTQGEDMNEMGGMAAPEDVPRLPPVKAYYEGEEVFFAHPEVSDQETADLLTDMMGSPVLVVPELADVPEEALADVYVFANGVRGDGPLGFQADIFDSAPGDEGYSPLRRLYTVTWKDEGQARELRTLGELEEAERNGEVTIEKQDVVINEPFLKWPGGQR